MGKKAINGKSEAEKGTDRKKVPDCSRRALVKKVAYSVPKLVLIGTFLSRPIRVRADTTGGPPPPPGDW